MSGNEDYVKREYKEAKGQIQMGDEQQNNRPSFFSEVITPKNRVGWRGGCSKLRNLRDTERQLDYRNPVPVSLRTPEPYPAGGRRQQPYPSTTWNSPHKYFLLPCLILQLCPYSGKELCFPF